MTTTTTQTQALNQFHATIDRVIRDRVYHGASDVETDMATMRAARALYHSGVLPWDARLVSPGAFAWMVQQECTRAWIEGMQDRANPQER